MQGVRQEYDRTVELHGKGICGALLQFKDVRIDVLYDGRARRAADESETTERGGHAQIISGQQRLETFHPKQASSLQGGS